jgi:hypothetical protein
MKRAGIFWTVAVGVWGLILGRCSMCRPRAAFPCVRLYPIEVYLGGIR